MDNIEASYYMILAEVAKQQPVAEDFVWIQRAVNVAYSAIRQLEEGNPTEIGPLRFAVVDLICILDSDLISSNTLKEEMMDIVKRLSIESSTRYIANED
jgi:hypothetical protein